MLSNDPTKRTDSGFSIIELLTVMAVIAILVAIASPAVVGLKTSHDTRGAIVELGGKLRTARAKALGDGIPHLVLIEKEEIVDGVRSTFALIVRDNDRSYSVTPPDDIERFKLQGFPLQVRQYAAEHTLLPGVASEDATSALDGDYMDLLGDYSQKMADGDASGNYSDVMAMYEDKAEDWISGGNPGCSGAGPCLDPGHPDYEPQFDPTSPDYDPAAVLALLNGSYGATGESTLTNGSSFPMSEVAGVPAIAFNEKGIPVDLDTPNAWGSGAGSVFVTDGHQTVYSASVASLGSIRERRYDAASNAWK